MSEGSELQTVVARSRHEGDPVKGSRFVATLAPVASEEEAQQFVASVRAEMPDASHHCSAWRLAVPLIDRASDDGEPGGSAGRPMLSQLQGRSLMNTAAVVTRYWGGTKLGVGGLVRAYGSAVGLAIDATQTVRWQQLGSVAFAHSYALTDGVERALTEIGAVPSATEFGAVVHRTVNLPLTAVEELAAALSDLSAGEIVFDPEADPEAGA